MKLGKYQLRVKYKNSNGECIFIGYYISVNRCFSEVKDILCDEIISVNIKKL
jgi:hypothetical protein